MNNEILNYAIENGIIDLSHIQEQIEMNKRQNILDQYKNRIWLAPDGFWKVRVDLDNVGKKKTIKRRKKEDLENFLINAYLDKTENPTIRKIFTEWVDRKLELQQITLQTKQKYCCDFERHFKVMGECKIQDLSPEDMSCFLEEQVSEHQLTAKSFSNLKTITRGTLKWAKRKKLIDWNIQELFFDLDVSDKCFKKRIKEDCEEVFMEDEMERITTYLKENPDMINLGIMLMFVTGIRVGELCALKWEDYVYIKEEDICILKIRRTEVRHFEDNKAVFKVKDFPKTEAGIRNVVIPNGCVWIMQRLRSMSVFYEYIFYNGKKRYNTYTFRNRLITVCKKTNCVQKSPHKIRKTYCSILLDHSIDNQMVISQMGHTSIMCSENYYHRNRRDVAQKQKIVDNIDEFVLLSK